MKMRFTDERQRERWLSAMQREVMSSEESEVEAGDEIVVVKKFPWRSDQLYTLIKRVDAKVAIDHTPQATQQTKKRIYRGVSTRPQPTINENMPAWLFA